MGGLSRPVPASGGDGTDDLNSWQHPPAANIRGDSGRGVKREGRQAHDAHHTLLPFFPFTIINQTSPDKNTTKRWQTTSIMQNKHPVYKVPDHAVTTARVDPNQSVRVDPRALSRTSD